MNATLTLEQLAASAVVDPSFVAAALEDEIRRGRVEQIGDGFTLTAAGLREFAPLRALTDTEQGGRHGTTG